MYRKGQLNSSGTISWSAAEQTVLAADTGYTYRYPVIAVDASYYPWISYVKYLRADPASDTTPYVTKSSTNDGTWSPDFNTQMNVTNDEEWVCVIVPLSSDDIFAVYAYDSANILGNHYTGGAWAGEVDSGVVMGTSATRMSATSWAKSFTGVFSPGYLWAWIRVFYCQRYPPEKNMSPIF